MSICLGFISESIIILLVIFISGVILLVSPIILSALLSTYFLPIIIILLYLYLLIFETPIYNIPQILENNIPNVIYTPFLFILLVIYINTCQISNY
jgi:hypothetical protein